MPHISKKLLKHKVHSKISDQFVNFISEYRNKNDLKHFLNEFLTGTEKIMLAKRLYLILLIKKGYQFSKIEKMLKLSPSTVVRFWKKHKTQEFQAIQGKLDKKKAKDKMIKDFNEFMRFGLPPIAGRGRWKFLYQNNKKK